jgi:hypothetical protein
MPAIDTDHSPGGQQPPITRRRFFRRGLAAGLSGLLALFGLADRAGRLRRSVSEPPSEFPPSSSELAG